MKTTRTTAVPCGGANSGEQASVGGGGGHTAVRKGERERRPVHMRAPRPELPLAGGLAGWPAGVLIRGGTPPP